MTDWQGLDDTDWQGVDGTDWQGSDDTPDEVQMKRTEKV